MATHLYHEKSAITQSAIVSQLSFKLKIWITILWKCEIRNTYLLFLTDSCLQKKSKCYLIYFYNPCFMFLHAFEWWNINSFFMSVPVRYFCKFLFDYMNLNEVDTKQEFFKFSTKFATACASFFVLKWTRWIFCL